MVYNSATPWMSLSDVILSERIQKQMSTYKTILFRKVHTQTKLIYAVRSQDSSYLGGRWGGVQWWMDGGMNGLGVTGNAAL